MNSAAGKPTGKFTYPLAILALVAYSSAVNLGVFQRDAALPPDSSAFLQVVDLINGKYHGIVAPFRILYPVYPYLAWALGKVVMDGLLAARIAAVIPALLCPLFTLLACRMLGCSRRSSWMAGFLVASWPPLITVARIPIYDSTFVCATAATLVCILAALRSRSMRAFLCAGLVCGIAAATRGPGLFFPAALVIPLWVAREVEVRRKIVLTAVGVLSCAAALSAVRLPAARLASSLPPVTQDCVKQVIADGILYSEGMHDSIVFELDSDCRKINNPTRRTCGLTWRQFAKEFGPRWIKMAARNWKRLVLRDLVGILFPFLLFSVPLCFALYQWLRVGRPGAQAVLVLTLLAFPFLVIVPAMQMQERYIYPLIVIICVVNGVGFDFARDSLARRANLLLVTGCLGLAALAGVDALRQSAEPDPVWANYRAASDSIVKSPDFSDSAGVMARTWGVYPYFGRAIVVLPSASLDRVLCYATAHSARFLIFGPAERVLDAQFVGEGRSPRVRLLRTFGKAPDDVQVFRIED